MTVVANRAARLQSTVTTSILYHPAHVCLLDRKIEEEEETVGDEDRQECQHTQTKGKRR